MDRARDGGDINRASLSNPHPPLPAQKVDKRAVDSAQVGQYGALDNPPVFGGWVGLATLIRKSLRSGNTHLPISNASDITSQSSTVITYYTPTMVYVGLIILLVLFTICSFCCLCYCPRGRLRFRYTSDYTGKEKVFAWIWFTLVAFFVASGAVGLIWGATYTSVTMGAFQISFHNLMNDTQKFAAGLAPATNTSFGLLRSAIITAADDITTISNQTLLKNGVETPLLQFASSMDSAHTTSEGITAGSAACTAYRSNIQSLATILDIQVTAMNSRTTVLEAGNMPTANLAVTYELNDNVILKTMDATSLRTASGSIPDTSGTFSPLQNLGLNRYAESARSTGTGLVNNVTVRIRYGSDAFKNNILPNIDSVRTSMYGILYNLSANTVTPGTNSLRETVDSSFLNPVTQNNLYKDIALYGIGSLLLAVPALNLAFLLLRSPRAVKGCAICTLPMTLIIQLLAVLFLIISVIFGDVCTMLFEGDPVYISQSLAGMKIVGDAMGARDKCYQNQSLLEIAVNYNLVSGGEVNFTTRTGAEFDKADFTALTRFNTTPAASLSENPASKLAPLLNLNTSSLTADLSTVATAIAAFRTLLNAQ
jgi:hypothetical protein